MNLRGHNDKITRDRCLSVLAMGFALCALALFIRGTISYYPVKTFWDARWIAGEVFHRSYYDVMTISSATTLAALAVMFMRQSPRGQRAVVGVYFVFSGLMALLFCVNSRALDMIGGSLTYQWLYYADFFRSFTPQSAIASNLDSSILGLLAMSVFMVTAGQRGLTFLLRRIGDHGLFRFSMGLTVVLMIGYLIHVRTWVHAAENNYREIANPLVELFSTALAGDSNALRNFPTSVSNADFQIGPTAGLSVRFNENKRVKNVILVVMESVGADYVIGSKLFDKAKVPIEVTPNLTKARAAGITFDNFYAHAPMSTKSLFSILASRYPLFSHETEISRIGNENLVTLSGRLRDAGYRTGFFMSGDFKFQNVDRFLVGRGFDILSDMNAIPCATPAFVGSTAAWSNLDSIDDSCTAAALNNWVADGRGAPFFGMLWTGNTHWPYFSRGEQAKISDDKPNLNRYLNALHSSDAAIGRIFEHLSQHSLLDDTLIVVIGDHGEAFGQHGFKVHGNDVFEEEVHIPLLMLNPRLFREERDEILGGLVDLAPTILDVLRIEIPSEWQGRSMFQRERSPRVYFTAPISEMIAGYREGDFKFILNLARNRVSVFDLKRDPQELRNLSSEMSAAANGVSERLAAWVQYQEKLFPRP